MSEACRYEHWQVAVDGSSDPAVAAEEPPTVEELPVSEQSPAADTGEVIDDATEMGPQAQSRAALLGAVTGLLAVLTAVGTANGTVARMFRNHAAATIIALALELVAILCGLLTQVGIGRKRIKQLLILGTVALVVGMLSALIAEVRTLSLGDRPTINTSIEVSGQNVVFKAHVEADAAKARDQVVVTVFGLDASGTRTPSIYYSKTGPNADGHLVQDVQLVVNANEYQGVYLTALVVSEHRRPPEVDCDGDEVGSDGQNLKATPTTGGSPQNVAFRPGGANPVVGCTVVEFPVATSS